MSAMKDLYLAICDAGLKYRLEQIRSFDDLEKAQRQDRMTRFGEHNICCDECLFGVVERECDDYDPDLGASFVPMNGGSVVYGECYPRTTKRMADWYCPDCTEAHKKVAV